MSNEPVFLFDEDLIAHGKALSVIYSGTIYVSSQAEAPARGTPDGGMYSLCRARGAVFVTADFNMLCDEVVLQELPSHVGLSVIWIRQIRGQSVSCEIARWPHIRRTIVDRPDVRGFVLAGNGHLVPYRSIGDAVIEVVRRRRGSREQWGSDADHADRP